MLAQFLQGSGAAQEAKVGVLQILDCLETRMSRDARVGALLRSDRSTSIFGPATKCASTRHP